MNFPRLTLLVAALSSLSFAQGAATTPYLHAPSVETYAKHDPASLTILSNGRFIKPVGRHFPIARWPHGLAMSRDGSVLFVASAGIGQIVTELSNTPPRIQEIVLAQKNGKKRHRLNAGGADFSLD